MIIRKEEKIYKFAAKKWLKHGKIGKELTYQTRHRKTIYLLFVPIFWAEKIIKSDLV
jgi:hypothetical protein